MEPMEFLDWDELLTLLGERLQQAQDRRITEFLNNGILHLPSNPFIKVLADETVEEVRAKLKSADEIAVVAAKHGLPQGFVDTEMLDRIAKTLGKSAVRIPISAVVEHDYIVLPQQAKVYEAFDALISDNNSAVIVNLKRHDTLVITARSLVLAAAESLPTSFINFEIPGFDKPGRAKTG